MQKLRQERERANLSQEELARKAGVSQQAISMLENENRKNPRIDTVASIARVLGCTVDDLIDDIDDTTTERTA